MAKQKINPSNAEANFFQRIKDAKKHLNPVMLELIGQLLLSTISDEYPYARVSVIFQVFASFCIGQISHQQHKIKGYLIILIKRLSTTVSDMYFCIFCAVGVSATHSTL